MWVLCGFYSTKNRNAAIQGMRDKRISQKYRRGKGKEDFVDGMSFIHFVVESLSNRTRDLLHYQ